MATISKKELRTIIQEEVATIVGQIKDQIYVAFLTQLKDEIRKDQLSEEPEGLANLVIEETPQPEPEVKPENEIIKLRIDE